jgi:hypothetical protein
MLFLFGPREGEALEAAVLWEAAASGWGDFEEATAPPGCRGGGWDRLTASLSGT